MTDTQLENLVDAVLRDMDLNGDGRIDFSEYLRKQQAT
jgi:Ca2+-binding EF-hand superfamily protein